MNECDKYRLMIERGFEGALGDEDAAALSNHLEGCGRCRAEFEIANFADGLMLAVAAPEVGAGDWRHLSQALRLGNGDDIGLPADAVRPPEVADEEWDRMWLDIERRTLLDGIAEVAAPSSMPSAIGRGRLRRVLGAFAAAAVLVIAVVAAYIHFSPRTEPGPPARTADVTKVASGYLYSRIDTGGEYPVHEIVLASEVSGNGSITPSRGFLASDEAGVAEITAAEDMPTSRVSAKRGYMYSPAQDSGVDEIGRFADIDPGKHYEEIRPLPDDKPSLPHDGGGNDD